MRKRIDHNSFQMVVIDTFTTFLNMKSDRDTAEQTYLAISFTFASFIVRLNVHFSDFGRRKVTQTTYSEQIFLAQKSNVDNHFKM